MIFNAIAQNGTGRKAQENLDSFSELQEFMNRMEKRGFLSVVVTATKLENGEAKSKVITYSFNGETWEKA